MEDQQPAPSSGASDASITPDAQLPPLDDQQVNGLREVAGKWTGRMPDREAWKHALPVDPHLTYMVDRAGRGSAFVGIRSGSADDADAIESTPRADEPDSRLGRALYLVRRVLIGPPLRSTAIAEERMSRFLALPVLSPDALSSVAYGPEAMMAVLVLAGSVELKRSLPIGAVLVVLMLAVGLGYRQVIRAYPHGGGSYIVAKDNLGPKWGLLAGAGLILDYILTVAVSVAAGVAAITSAIPSAASATVPLGLVVIAVLVFGNLRGVKAAGALFAAPTYMFVAAIGLIVIVGLVDSASHGFHAIAPPPRHATEALGVLLILRSFSSGATAMTGIEVISNSVPVFEPPEAENARRTLTIMIVLLVSMFIGVVVVAYLEGIAPGTQTVLSQIAHRTVGDGVLYAYVQIATTAILLIAANSAVNGFPRLLYFMARDKYAPMAFLHLGDRLAFTAGIAVLAIPAAIVYAAFNGQTEPLIPLFAIGVFVAFCLAQSGMVAHWWHHQERGWKRALAINLLGAVLSGAVAIIAAITKFVEGAWLVVVLIPLIVLACLRVHHHYQRAYQQLLPRADETLAAPRVRVSAPQPPRDEGGPGPEAQDAPSEIEHLLIVPVAALDLAALRALAYAASLGVPVLAVHVSPTEEEGKRFHRYWKVWGDYLPLEVVLSPYRATVAPLANYIEALHRQKPDLTLTVIVPEVVPSHRWESILHGHIAPRLRRTLIQHPGIVVTSVPFHLEG
ncbi:MAG TPA: APC family permease [Solirubrobacteraceae bacterium]|nr:APC family permease [Solirubrobacteraceae bacterium]